MTLKLYGNGNIENVDSITTSASATLSATELGYIDGVTSALQTQLNNAGKILQIVRATDSTSRSTTSTSYVDASISVTITPTKSTSALLLVWSFYAYKATSNYAKYRITDNSNNAISGAEGGFMGIGAAGGSDSMLTLIAYATPATTSAVTYKGRFLSNDGGGAASVGNNQQTGQLFAIEVAA